MTQTLAAIFGCEGERLSAEEKRFFRAHLPVGFILFARNCVSPAQVKSLVAEMKECVGDDSAFILIDQEGGRVARLKPPHWRAAPPAMCFADKAVGNLAAAKQACYLNARLIAAELHELGINVDCAPLADIPVAGSHDIIGDRAFGRDAEMVATLGREMARGLTDGGVLPVLKHIPGHGRAQVDSHESLPVVEESLSALEHADFVPFKKLADLPLGMTAHILYSALDNKRVATLSPVVIRYIREKIGFDGALMSDDVSMKALAGDIGILSKDILAAGCDLVLHCNGKMEEMQRIAANIGGLSAEAARRVTNAKAQLIKPKAIDMADAARQVDDLLSKVA